MTTLSHLTFISVTQYQQSKEQGFDVFGKKTFPASFAIDEPVHAMMITPCIHYTMGGLFSLGFFFTWTN